MRKSTIYLIIRFYTKRHIVHCEFVSVVSVLIVVLPMTPIIGYWTYRANVEPILLTMRQINQPYQLKTYKQGDGSDYLGDEWPIDKKGLGLIYPNVPYYIEGDVKITQVNCNCHLFPCLLK